MVSNKEGRKGGGGVDKPAAMTGLFLVSYGHFLPDSVNIDIIVAYRLVYTWSIAT